VRRFRIAVVNALVAEASTDASLRRPDETAEEILTVIVAVACRGDRRLFARDSCGEFGWRVHRRGRQSADAFNRPVTRHDGNARVRAVAVWLDDADDQRSLLIATGAENGHAVLTDMHRFAGNAEPATGPKSNNNQSALRQSAGQNGGDGASKRGGAGQQGNQQREPASQRPCLPIKGHRRIPHGCCIADSGSDRAPGRCRPCKTADSVATASP